MSTSSLRKPPLIIAPEHRNDPLVCGHCGTIEWDRAPDLYKVYKRFTQRRRITTAEMAESLAISVPNASEKIKRLVNLGLVVRELSVPIPEIGGRLNTYALATHKGPVADA